MQKTSLFVAALMISTATYANSANDVLTQLLDNTHTMQADFTQRITDKTAKPLQQSQGKMALQRPGKFRWEVSKPISQLIVANGAKLWIYDPDLEQVTIRGFTKAASQTPALMLSDEESSLEVDYHVKSLKNPNSPLQWFVLTPKDEDSMFEEIKLAFLNNQIREMDLRDHLGHTTVIQFQNVRINQPLTLTLFQFKPPANIDVIDETTH